MSPSPNTSGNAGSSGNPLSLASDAATVLHPYRQNRRREVLITNANLRGQPNAVEATPGRTTGPFFGPARGLLRSVVLPAQQIRQLGDVRCHAAGVRSVFGIGNPRFPNQPPVGLKK